MDSDFRPAKRPNKSLRADLDTLASTRPADDEPFRTPEEIAAADDIDEPAELAQISDGMKLDDSSAPKPKKTSGSGSGWRDKLKLHWPPGRKEWIVALVVVLLSGSVAAALVLYHKPAPKIPPIPKSKPPISKTVPSTLSGLPVDPSVNLRPVTGVMIENSIDARPQSGLSQAMVVFEALAEGGVTRFLALYQDTAPNNVGPIRSARPYYVQWDLGFDAPYAHVGGSPDALTDIKNWNVRDLNQFYNGAFYHRVSSRAAPHNVYTSITTLNQLEANKNYLHSNFTGFARKKEAPSKQPTVRTINLTLSGPIYNVHYDYVAASNSYNRSEGGAPHVDANTNTQISPKVVIALVIPESNGALDSSGAYYSNYASIGSGTAYIFQDGTVTTGQWTKSGNTSQLTFTDASGKTIRLNPGQTWLTAVGSTSNVSYAP